MSFILPQYAWFFSLIMVPNRCLTSCIYSSLFSNPDDNLRTFFLEHTSYPPFSLALIHTDNILYIETCRHYLDFHCLDRKLHVRGQISEYEEVLRSCSFARAHQGYLVNLCHVSFISKKSVTLKNGSEISFSRSYRDTFIEAYMNWERSQKHVLTV